MAVEGRRQGEISDRRPTIRTRGLAWVSATARFRPPVEKPVARTSCSGACIGTGEQSAYPQPRMESRAQTCHLRRPRGSAGRRPRRGDRRRHRRIAAAVQHHEVEELLDEPQHACPRVEISHVVARRVGFLIVDGDRENENHLLPGREVLADHALLREQVATGKIRIGPAEFVGALGLVGGRREEYVEVVGRAGRWLDEVDEGRAPCDHHFRSEGGRAGAVSEVHASGCADVREPRAQVARAPDRGRRALVEQRAAWRENEQVRKRARRSRFGRCASSLLPPSPRARFWSR